MVDVPHGTVSETKSPDSKVNMTRTGNTGVGVRQRSGCSQIGKKRERSMRKVDESKARWIVREKRKGTSNRRIAEAMKISVRRVQQVWRRFKDADAISYPEGRGRPRRRLSGRMEHSAVLAAAQSGPAGAVHLEEAIEEATGIHIPHNTIHEIMRDEYLAEKQDRKTGQRRWVRYERTHSNSMWHTDYKLLDDGRWFICYLDDASRFVTGWDVFKQATTGNALKVLGQAIADHGKPASILTDHGSQFYANGSEQKKKGTSLFEERLVELGIRHILARVGHPQTNGKLERLHGEIQRKLHFFKEASYGGKTRGGGSGKSHVGGPFHTGPERDPVDRFIEWYNHHRPHMSLDRKSRETPARAFIRKMAPAGETVVDAQSGEEYLAD